MSSQADFSVTKVPLGAGTAAKLRAGRPRSRCSIPGKGKGCFALHKVQTTFGAHQASYKVGTGGKATGA
jgi:hypothetical protein